MNDRASTLSGFLRIAVDCSGLWQAEHVPERYEVARFVFRPRADAAILGFAISFRRAKRFASKDSSGCFLRMITKLSSLRS